MPAHKYLIIGGGMTGDAAIRGIRQVDEDGSIGMISEEPHPPYNRPPLSKSLWAGKAESSIWRPLDDLNVDAHLGRRAIALDAEKKQVEDHAGEIHSFEKLLLAVGGSVNRFPFGGDEIIYFRNLDDYRRLLALAEKKERFAVIGGGFIGSEIAAALIAKGRTVTMLFPEENVGANLFPQEIASHMTSLFQNNGATVLSGQLVTNIEKKGEEFIISTESEDSLVVDAVVAGIGIKPNISLAAEAGLDVQKGILVNKFLQTSHPDIYAAGDAAEFFISALGSHVVVEHEENANMAGYLAGMGMAGTAQEYDYLPYFYSSIFDIKYEGVGETSSRLETVIDWKDPLQEGVVYYLSNGRVRGVVCWNLRKKLKSARGIIGESGPFEAADLIGKI